MTGPPTEPTDYDSPWKEALEQYFPQFLALCAPTLHETIDWNHDPQFFDKELQALSRNADSGRRYADKLVRVRGRKGKPPLILVHVEIQGGVTGPEAMRRFSERMFQYFCRINDRYLAGRGNHQPEATHLNSDLLNASGGADGTPPRQYPDSVLFSLGILTESTGGSSYLKYSRDYLGCGVQFRFPVVHLARWNGKWKRLENIARGNPFAVVVMAQLRAQASREGNARLASKIALTRLLYKYRYSRKDTLRLLRLTDWIINLPPNLMSTYRHEVEAIEQEQNMAYVTSFERLAQQEAVAAVLRAQMQSKFGTLPAWAQEHIAAADSATLQQWALNLLQAESIETVFTPQH